MIPKFYLEDPKGTGICYIRVRVRIGGPAIIKQYLSPEIKIAREHWDHNAQRAKSSYYHARSFNLYLDKVSRDIQSKWWELKNDNRLTKYEMKRALKLILRGEGKEDLFDVFRMIADEKKNNPLYSKTLNDKYTNIIKKLEKFNPKLNFDDITPDSLSKWVNYLFTEDQLSTNTVARYVTFLKTLMNESSKRGYHRNDVYKDFSIRHTKTVYPYLSVEELDKIYNKDMGHDHLENAKILLLKGCYSGQRYSDWHKVKKDNLIKIGDHEYYRISNKKTRDVVHILAFDKLKHLVNMESRNISLQKFNVYVKDVCEIAEIDQPFVKPTYQGNVMREEQFQKFQLVTSHIARRSFVCNSILAGVPHETIMKVGGWKSEKSFRKYVQLSSLDGLGVFHTAFN